MCGVLSASPSVISLDKSGRTSRGGGSKGKKEQKDKGGKCELIISHST